MNITPEARIEAAAHLDQMDLDAMLAWRDSAARLLARHSVGTDVQPDATLMRMLAIFEYADAHVRGKREIDAMATAN